MFCHKCGTKVIEGEYCSNCGQKIIKSEVLEKDSKQEECLQNNEKNERREDYAIGADAEIESRVEKRKPFGLLKVLWSSIVVIIIVFDILMMLALMASGYFVGALLFVLSFSLLIKFGFSYKKPTRIVLGVLISVVLSFVGLVIPV